MINQSNSTQKAIIILHGWGSSPYRWEEFASILEKKFPKYNILIPYLPGFDENNPLKEPFDIKKYSEWLASFLKKKKINNPILIGHSHGGRIALYFTSHEKNMSMLVLIASAGVPTGTGLKKIVFKILSLIGKNIFIVVPGEKIKNLFKKALYKVARESDYLKASPVMKKTMASVLSYNALPDLKNITIPTLCIWGDKDTSTPLSCGKKIHKNIKDSQFRIVAGGHNIHITNPYEVANIVTDFIKNNDN